MTKPPAAVPAVAPSPPTSTEEKSSADATLEFLWRSFANVNEWVRFSDTKAGAVTAGVAAILGAAISWLGVAPRSVSGHWATIVWLAALVVVCFYSVAHAVTSLIPQLTVENFKIRFRAKNVQPEESGSLMFFMDINRRFPTAERYQEKVAETIANPEEAIRQVSHQVWANARVAVVKYRRVEKALRALSVAVGLTFIGVIVFVTIYLVAKINGN